MIRAALFDFGGVILSSPFEAFSRYEADHDLPDGFIRTLNATDPDTNAWARLERGDVDFETFCTLFEDEARAAGGDLDARAVMELLGGELRPEMVEAVRRCREHLKTACLTNNFVSDVAGAPDPGRRESRLEVLDLFDVVVESSKVGVRKPDTRFYEIACDLLEVEPSEAVFLDDLGVNLKPARAMGMLTIKVDGPGQAIAELEEAVGFPLR